MAICHWYTSDIIQQGKSRGLEISEDQAKDILQSIANSYDCSTGVNWDVIDIHIDKYFNL